MRRFLDGLYGLSGILGAVSIMLLGLTVLVQIVGRLMSIQIPGTDDISAWFMAAAAFFSLAYAFRGGAHIRVTVLFDRLSPGRRRWLDLICLLVAALALMIFTGSAVDLVYNSWLYGEIAQGILRLPLWIPQLTMVVGSAIFLIAILDDFFCLLCGGETSYSRADIGSSEGISLEELEQGDSRSKVQEITGDRA